MSVSEVTVSATPSVPVVEARQNRMAELRRAIGEWRNRTFQPTREQLQSAGRSIGSATRARFAAATEALRGALGGPTHETLADISRRLGRIEARLESFGGKENAREKKSA